MTVALLVGSFALTSHVETVQLIKGATTGWLYAKVTINGKEAVLAVDTGCYSCILTPAGARRLGLPCVPTGVRYNRVFAGATEEFKALHCELGVSRRRSLVTLFHVQAVSLGFDRSHAEADGVPFCDGLLGYPVLMHYASQIDYLTRTLRVRDSRLMEGRLLGHWRTESIKYAGDETPEPDGRGRLGLTADALSWTHPSGRLDGCWLLDLSATPRLMNWQVRDERRGGFTQAVVYRVDGDTLTIAGRILPDGGSQIYRPLDLSPAATKPFDVITLRRVPEAAPPPRPAR